VSQIPRSPYRNSLTSRFISYFLFGGQKLSVYITFPIPSRDANVSYPVPALARSPRSTFHTLGEAAVTHSPISHSPTRKLLLASARAFFPHGGRLASIESILIMIFIFFFLPSSRPSTTQRTTIENAGLSTRQDSCYPDPDPEPDGDPKSPNPIANPPKATLPPPPDDHPDGEIRAAVLT